MSSSSPSGWVRCLQPCLSCKKVPILLHPVQERLSAVCAKPKIAWNPGLQLHRTTSSKLPALGAAPATPSPCSTKCSRNPRVCCRHPAHAGQEKRRALPHLEIPEIPVDHRCFLTTGLPSTPRDLPSLYSSFSSLPPHSWSCLTLAGQGFTLSFPPRERTSSFGPCKGLGLD